MRLRCASTVMVAIGLCMAGARAEDAAQPHEFDIDTQPVRTGILDLSRQSGVQILVTDAAAGDQWGAAVKGRFTTREAVERLLAGTSLEVRADDGRTMILGRRPLESRPLEPHPPELEEIVVTGQRLAQMRALQEKRDAIGVRDVVSADEIGRLPDKNAAESAERLPGVSLHYDQGEGRYVSIRGVDASLNNVTVNGVGLGTPDGDSRAMPLDVISAQLVSRIEVVKAVTPDMDAQALGGTINLVTQSPFDQNRPFFGRASVQAGHEQLNDGTPAAGSLTLGGLFGPDRTWGLLLGANYSARDYRTYGVYPDDWRAVPGFDRGLPVTLKDTIYDLDRRRLGLNAALEVEPTDRDRFYLRGLFSRFREDERRQRYRLDFATAGLIGNGQVTAGDGETGTSVGAEARVDLRLEQKEKQVATAGIGGEHRRGSWEVSYDLSWVENRLKEPNQVWSFRGGAVTADFDMGPLLFALTPRADAPPGALGFNQYSTQDNHGKQRAGVARLDLKRALPVADEGSYLKVGAKYRADRKQEDDGIASYGPGSGAFAFTLADFDLAGPRADVAVDGQTYAVFPTINREAIRAFTARFRGTGYFVPNEAATLAASLRSDYRFDEDIASGYAMANLVVGQITLTGGLRVEHTAITAAGTQVTNGSVVTPVKGTTAYTDLLPNLHLRYDPTEEVVLRASVTRTLGRPAYSTLAPAAVLTFETLPGGSVEGELFTGNPDLRPYKASNYDLAGEYYFAKGGLLSAALFHKRIRDPAFTYRDTRTDTVYGGVHFDRLEFQQARNGGHAWITGLELAVQQQFTGLPGFWAGFGLAANLTLTDSVLTLPDGGRVPFPRQADRLYGAQLFYQRSGIEAALSYHHGGAYLNAVSDSRATDFYVNRYRRLDTKISYALTESASLSLELQNLLDESQWEYQGGRPDWVTGHERYGRTAYLGLGLTW